MKVLIIGLGSIASKHITALRAIDSNIQILALRSGKAGKDYEGIQNLYQWDSVPGDIDFIIISNPTSEHADSIEKALVFEKPLFIEKPPLASFNKAEQLLKDIKKAGVKTYIAFNLRFHPIIQFLKSRKEVVKALEVSIYCGSYLPDWRPNLDYRSNYSARKELGGGVHLDLIHELDYSLYLFGQPDFIFQRITKVSNLEIDSADSAMYYLEYEHCNLSIKLNYFRPLPQRQIEIVFDNDIWTADLLTNEIINSKGDIVYHTQLTQKDTYFLQMHYFLDHFRNNEEFENNLENAIKTLELALGNDIKK